MATLLEGRSLTISGPSGHQTFPWGCAPRESLITLVNSLGQIFPDNQCGLSTVYTRDPPAGTLSDICAGHHVPQGRQLNASKTTGTVLVQQQLDDASAASLLYFCLSKGLNWFSSSFSLCQLNYISFMVCLGRKRGSNAIRKVVKN